ncbi:MAG: aminoacyl-histidine dipeptidase [Eubacteriales bacterium]|nr:aminoacyl-histidine dipeptidase [Eubacteriales bacterium]
MSVLSHLEPKGVFTYFEQLCAIPHGSGNTKQVSNWLVAFAQERKLPYWQDELNNVIICKAASSGYEASESVILQGHMDMVCEKAADCTKDMAHEGLDLAVDGDKIYAKGTTLGADDGIAVAIMLALLDDEDLAHPALECIFTVDEEIGMPGAAGIDVSMLQGRRMLNLDSEDEGVFTVSCAGGSMVSCRLPVMRENMEGTVLTVRISGLQGGHSGIEINKGRANANMLMGRVLRAIGQKTETRLICVEGGKKDNVIPNESTAQIVVQDREAAQGTCAAMELAFRNEYAITDSGVRVCVTESESYAAAMNQAATERVICMLNCLPNGIQAMSADIEGLVQTSLNMGILTSSDTEVEAVFSVRSSIASQKEMLWERLACLMEQLGGSTVISGSYPGWQYRKESPLRDLMMEVFTQQYGYAPKIEAIHAGVECGLFADKLPGLDCVSYGPELKEIHTCRERMSLSSVQRVWAMTVEVLRRMK